jgi:hypothetical protein
MADRGRGSPSEDLLALATREEASGRTASVEFMAGIISDIYKNLEIYEGKHQ